GGRPGEPFDHLTDGQRILIPQDLHNLLFERPEAGGFFRTRESRAGGMVGEGGGVWPRRRGIRASGVAAGGVRARTGWTGGRRGEPSAHLPEGQRLLIPQYLHNLLFERPEAGGFFRTHESRARGMVGKGQAIWPRRRAISASPVAARAASASTGCTGANQVI